MKSVESRGDSVSLPAASPLLVSNTRDAREYVIQSSHTHVKIGFTDIDGVMRGKYISKEKFLSSLEEGISFCDVVIGWDSNDQLYDNSTITGWNTGYPDAKLRIIPESLRLIPFENDLPLFLCELDDPAAAVCPRRLLTRVIDRLKSAGFSAFVGTEYEFFLFNETPDTVRSKGYRNLQTMTPGYFGYSLLRSSVKAEFYRDLISMCQDMNIPLEGLHTETGPGVIEAAIGFDEALKSADKAALFKTFVKVFAQRRELMATFMARWSEQLPGQSGHLHLSLRADDGQFVFHDSRQPHGMSACMRHFVGGMQALLPEFACMSAPTVNSYARLVPGFWAPTHASWAIENRTVALRAILGNKLNNRVEYRVASADANPYLAISGALASGLWGIENEIEPTSPISGNGYTNTTEEQRLLPTDLAAAAEKFENSKAAREIFGDTFVDHFVMTRQWEVKQFQRYITDWELQRYFEII